MLEKKDGVFFVDNEEDVKIYNGDYDFAGNGGKPVFNRRKARQKKIGRHTNLWKYTATAVCGMFAGAIIFGSALAFSGQQTPQAQQTTSSVSASNTTNHSPVLTAATSEDGLSIVDIAKKAGPAVVGIINKQQSVNYWGQSTEQTGSGSGIIIRSDGYIITNSHVIEGADSVTVITSTNEEYSATVVGQDAKTDLAVIKVNASGLPTAEIGSSADLQVGELAVAIGNPLGQEFAGSVTAGVISALNRSISIEGRQYTLIQTDAAINPGNSGGALLNDKGQVIGINSVKISSSELEGMGFAIPIDDAMTIIEELMDHGYVKGRPVIGIASREINSATARRYGLVEGVYVVQVNEGSGAEKAGLQIGDVIVAADGKTIKTLDELNEIRDSHKSGETIQLTIMRNNESKQTVNVVLGEEKPN